MRKTKITQMNDDYSIFHDYMRCGSLSIRCQLTNTCVDQNDKQDKWFELCNQWPVVGFTFLMLFSLSFAAVRNDVYIHASFTNLRADLKNDETACAHHIKAIVVAVVMAEIMY